MSIVYVNVSEKAYDDGAIRNVSQKIFDKEEAKMGKVTKAVRNGCETFYTMHAFFFDVLVSVDCSQSLFDKSDLHFYLTFEKETFFGNPAKELSDNVFGRMLELSISKGYGEEEYMLKKARQDRKMTIVRPRPSSFDGFRAEVLSTLEQMEDIFHELASRYGSVMTLTIGKGIGI